VGSEVFDELDVPEHFLPKFDVAVVGGGDYEIVYFGHQNLKYRGIYCGLPCLGALDSFHSSLQKAVILLLCLFASLIFQKLPLGMLSTLGPIDSGSIFFY
jgi:hypothetical protein